MSAAGPITTLLRACSALQLVVGVGIILTVCIRGSNNHSGFEPRWVALLPILSAFGMLEGLVARAPARALALCLVSTLFLGGLVLAIDHWNVLVQYDLWVKRGMPRSPFTAR